jgi:hypothetical protein
MSKPSDSLNETLGRQRDPEPPVHVEEPAPSLWLYVGLLIVAFALIFNALASQTQDWPALCLNVGSNIIGAVIILIVVERRLRTRELRAIRRVPQTTGLYLAMACFPSVRQIVGFARVLSSQMEAIEKPYYIPRPKIEAAAAAKMEHGFILVGGPGTGKSTLLHRIVLSAAAEAARRPGAARIPILVSARDWRGGDVEDTLFETMRSYHHVSACTFRKALRKGRLLCVFDSIDEALEPRKRIEAIKELRRRYPRNAVILSSRPFPDASLDMLELEQVEAPLLSADEAARLLELRKRWAEGQPQ